VKVPITEVEAEAEKARRQRGAKSGKSAASSRKLKSKRKVSNNRKKVKSKYVYTSDEESVDSTDIDDIPSKYDDLEGEVLDWCSYINTFDVCITTYNVLRQDFNVARPAPVRPRREDVVYSSVERTRSPLVMCEWYRVIMDEV
jgi:E3 ubiquitin-protein ligase SHPRH